MPKRKTYYDSNAAKDPEGDTYGALFASMMKDSKFQHLSWPARELYTLCRVQAQTKKGIACLAKYNLDKGKEYDIPRCFVFPATHQKEYGLNPRNTTRYFNELIKAGFIERVEANKYTREVNVYSFSPKWKGS